MSDPNELDGAAGLDAVEEWLLTYAEERDRDVELVARAFERAPSDQAGDDAACDADADTDDGGDESGDGGEQSDDSGEQSDDGDPGAVDAPADVDVDARLGAIADRFELAPVERTVLTLAVAPDLDPRFGRAYSRLQTDATIRRPTVDLLVDVVRANGGSGADALGAVATASPLVRFELLDLRPLDAGSTYRSRIVSPTPALASAIFGEPPRSGPGTVVETEASLEDLPVSDATRDRLADVPTDDPVPSIFSLAGGDEPVRERAVAALANAAGDDVLRVRAAAVADDPRLWRRAIRRALLSGAALHVAGLDALEATAGATRRGDDGRGASAEARRDRGGCLDAEDLVRSVADLPLDVYCSAEEPVLPTGWQRDRRLSLIEFPTPGYELRQALWAERTEDLPAELSPAELAGTFRLTQGEVDEALAAARALAGEEDVEPTDVYRGCRLQTSAELDDLAERIEPGYAWDDIVLPEEAERELRAVAAQITERGTVYSEWGFARKFARGTGIVALFAGPSGTGKTMAAEVLANHVGLDLYRIDLSTVVSKYVGETEENLERIFEAAERSSAVLLFDEADAVFGARAEVAAGTDRYANVEVNYLLQRIESYDGVVLLTTNYESNIDEAFTRRVDRRVSFARPDRAVREELWRTLVPEDTPTADLDYAALATFDLAGGDIRNAIQTAAFAAARADERLSMEQLVPAVQRELEKQGTLVDPAEFDEYREFLKG